jgi:hypothetical protein
VIAGFYVLLPVFVTGLDVDGAPDELDDPERPDPLESPDPFDDTVDGLGELVSAFDDESDFSDVADFSDFSVLSPLSDSPDFSGFPPSSRSALAAAV